MIIIKIMICNLYDLKNNKQTEKVFSIEEEQLENWINLLPSNLKLFLPEEPKSPHEIFTEYGLTTEEIYDYQKWSNTTLIRSGDFIVGRFIEYFHCGLYIPDHPFFKNAVYNYFYQEVAKYIIERRKYKTKEN